MTALALVLAAALSASDEASKARAALALEEKGDDAAALAALDQLVHAEPTAALYRLEAARLRLKRGDDLDRAELDLEAARSLAPENPRAHFLYAQLMQERGNAAEAIRSLERAVLERPDYADARERLGALYLERGDLPAAEDQYRAVAQKQPDRTPDRLQLALVLEKEGRLADAEGELKHLHEEQPRSVVVTRRLAELYDRMGQPKLAAKVRGSGDPKTKRKLRDLKKSVR